MCVCERERVCCAQCVCSLALRCARAPHLLLLQLPGCLCHLPCQWHSLCNGVSRALELCQVLAGEAAAGAGGLKALPGCWGEGAAALGAAHAGGQAGKGDQQGGLGLQAGDEGQHSQQVQQARQPAIAQAALGGWGASACLHLPQQPHAVHLASASNHGVNALQGLPPGGADAGGAILQGLQQGIPQLLKHLLVHARAAVALALAQVL